MIRSVTARRAAAIAVATSAAVTLAAPATAETIELEITVENLSPAFGTYFTPLWFGVHDGGFDLFDAGSAASSALERIAEDGNVMPLQQAFMDSGHGAAQGLVAPGGPFAPGAIATTTFSVDTTNPDARFLSYAAMILPSNDAFIGNDGADAVRILGDDGSFVGADFFVTGADVWDAGTEVNDELPENTAFLGQAAPDTGTPEGGVVRLHEGFNGSFGNPGTPGILSLPEFAGADFTLPGYPVARISVALVPAPGALALLGVAGLAGGRRRRG